MKRALIAAAVLVALVVAGALIAPSFIDWNRYKGEIAAQAEAATGRRLAIDGDVSLALLPTPALRVDGVRLANLPGAVAEEMVSLKSLRVRVAFLPLLRGNVQVESVRLVQPVIALEVLGDGRKNWELTPGAVGAATPEQGPSGGPPGSPPPVQLDSLEVVDGIVTYRPGPAGPAEQLEDVDLRIRAETLAGPFTVSGTLRARGIPVTLRVGAGRIDEGRPAPATLQLGIASGDAAAQVRFEGQVATTGNMQAEGRLRAEAASLAALLRSLGVGGKVPASRFSLDAQLSAGPEEAALNDLSLTLGQTSGAGAVNVGFGRNLTVDATLATNHLDIDALVASLDAPAPPPAPPSRPAAPSAAAPAEPAETVGFSLPDGLDGSINVTVAAASWRGSIIRQVQLAATLDSGAVMLERSGALLPGGSDVSISGLFATPDGKPRFDGRVEASSDNIRAVLDWLQVDVAAVPEDRLRKLQFASGISVSGGTVQAGDIDLRLDSSRLTGAVAYALRTRPAFSANLALDRINVDAYLPRAPEAASSPAAAAPAGAARAVTAAERPPLAFLADFDANTQIRVGQLTWNQTPVEDMLLDARLVAGVLTLNSARVQNLAGSEVTVSGTARGFATEPGYEFKASLSAANLSGLARLAGTDLPQGLADLKQVALSAVASGGLQGLQLSDLQAKAGPLEIAGEIGLQTGGPRPKLTARLTGNELLLDRFLPAAGAAAGRGGRTPAAGTPAPASVPAGEERWSREPLDLSALALVDADVRLAAKRLEVRGYDVGEPSLHLTLDNGSLRLDQVGGRLFGGALALTGHVKAGEQPAAAVDLSLDGADLKQALGAAAGLDTVSGRFALRSKLESAGASPFELVRNLAGRADVTAEKGAVQGVDLKRLSDRLHQLSEITDYLDLVGRSLSGGETRLNAASGSWIVQNGIARTADTRAELDAALATLAGTVDLPDWRLDLQGQVRLTEHEDAPAIGIALQGPIDEPKRDFKTRELEQFLTERLGGSLLRKGIGGETLRDVLGGGSQPGGEAPQGAQGDAEPAPRPKATDVLKGILQGLGNR